MTTRPAPVRVAPREQATGVSVVICAYSESRWQDLVDALRCVRRQTLAADELIVVADHNPRLLERLGGLPDVIAVANARDRGLAGARNSGVAAATSAVIAFLDDDAVPASDWLERLLAPYADPAVLGTGGSVEPWWLSERPRWFPPEFDWVVGCGYRGLPAERQPIRNPIGANMSFRRELLERLGGFREGIGRVGRVPLGCEETELSIRARQATPGGLVIFEPAATVRHRVPAERGAPAYFASRCFAEGISKALVSSSVGRDEGLSSERRYVLGALPRGLGRGLADAVRGDLAGAARAFAIAAGLALTAAGYLAGATRMIRSLRPAR